MSINPFQDSGVSEVPEANDRFADGQEPFVEGIDNDVFGLQTDHAKQVIHTEREVVGSSVSPGADGVNHAWWNVKVTETVIERQNVLGRLMGKNDVISDQTRLEQRDMVTGQKK